MAIGLWTAAAVVWAISLWTIVATVVHVARGKGRAWTFDVIAAVIFHGGTAALAIWLAQLARSAGSG